MAIMPPHPTPAPRPFIFGADTHPTRIPAVVPNICILIFSAREMLRLLARADAVATLVAAGNVQARRNAGEPFLSYTERFADYSAQTLKADTLGPQAMIYACITAMCACTVLCNGVAIHYWDRYVYSRRAVFAGWFCLFAAPFLLSIVPLNLFISWSKLPLLVDTYTDEFLRRFDPEPLFSVAQRNIKATCMGIRTTGATQDTVQQRVQELCGIPPCEGAALRNLTCSAWVSTMAATGGSMTVLQAAAAAASYTARLAEQAVKDAARKAADAVAAVVAGTGTQAEAEAAEEEAAAAEADAAAARDKEQQADKDIADSTGLPLVVDAEVKKQAPTPCGLIGAALPYELVVPGMPYGRLKSFCDTLGSGLEELKKKRVCASVFGVIKLKCSDSVGEIAGSNSVLDSRCPSTPEKRLDLTQAHSGCCQARRLLLDGSFDQARAQTIEACTAIEPALNATIDMLKEQVQIQGAMAAVQVQRAGELLVSVSHAITSLKIMVPAAMSLAPGLLHGSMAVKTLVPQSPIPGILVLILPWMYCPLVWCTYNVLLQLIGNWVMVGSMVVIAYLYMAYFFVGIRWHITKPMTDMQLRSITKCIYTYLQIVSIVAYAGAAYGLAFSRHTNIVEDQLSQLLSVGAVAGIVVNAVGKSLFTKVAGVDAIVTEIADQYRWEMFLEGGGEVKEILKLVKQVGGGSDGAHYRGQVTTLMADRKARLAELYSLTKSQTYKSIAARIRCQDGPGAIKTPTQWKGALKRGSSLGGRSSLGSVAKRLSASVAVAKTRVSGSSGKAQVANMQQAAGGGKEKQTRVSLNPVFELADSGHKKRNIDAI